MYFAVRTRALGTQQFSLQTLIAFLFSICSIAAASNAPLILSVDPDPGDVSLLTGVTVKFSESVIGVTADDFLVNNKPSSSVTGSGDTYTFNFPQPAYGQVDITWEAGNGITDLEGNAFDSTAASASWGFLLFDATVPMISAVNPPKGQTIRILSQVDVTFSEPVSGVDAADLLVNGFAATNLVMRPNNVFTFQFAAAARGTVNITWASDHGITDQALPANAFVPEAWSYTVDSTLGLPQVIISEFLAAAENAAGLKDEDGELQDWIEIYNASSVVVNLKGWSLTDDPENPDLWLFPDINLDAGARLIVFASAKDRRPATAGSKLHTNFKLNSAGEYLALFNAESPRIAFSEFSDFPEQRNDYSYGLDSSGLYKYFQTPTPGLPNGNSSIVGIVPKPKVNIKRGTFDAAFNLVITNELDGVTIRYTTDGSEPTATSPILPVSLLVSKTTVVRVAAFKPNYLPSETITESYIFLDQVLVQPNNPPGFPVGPTVMGGYPSDYEMDPEVVNNAAYKDTMKAALNALPILSIAIKPDDMFGAVNGIYTHPLNRGPSWERPCSVEFVPQDGKGFQVSAGIQVQGNAARDPQKQPKHPLRIVFKGDYGPAKLHFKMFPDSAVETFDTFVLRADFNFSWLHWAPLQRTRAQRIRDSFMKDSMRAMGDLASHNRYAHLYINGVYWGIYDPTERPDATFAATYLGGEKEDWDVINEGAAVDGTMTAYNAMLALGNMFDINQYNLMKKYLDMPQFIDYMLLHFYVGHEDWGFNKNWYTMRPKNGSAGFKYVPWDGENMLSEPTFNRVSNTDVPSGLHTKLLLSPQYKMDFADRVQKHLFNNGALTPDQVKNRFLKRAREIELPIIAESARWGDYRRDVHQYQTAPYELYTRDNQWRTEQNRLLNTYFPSRTATVLNQLKTAGLYPSLAAPIFNQQGGHINPGFNLTMSATGTVFYTTNGIDPRVYGSGAISTDAKIYSGGIPLPGSLVVKARAYNSATWSALNEAIFSAETLRPPVRITEIMYNPNPAGDAFEFVELQNLGPLPFDISSYYFHGMEYVFAPGTILAPGQIVLLASNANPLTFAQRYPGVTPFGYFAGHLLNSGEKLALLKPDGSTVVSVDYDDENGWTKLADGGGYSLEIIDPFADPDDPANWKSSAVINGSPGKANSRLTPSRIRLNEISAAATTGPDWIELYNSTANPVDISNWTLKQAGNGAVLIFPSGTSIAGNGFIVILADKQTNSPGLHTPFALSSKGESLFLNDNFGARGDAISFGPQAANFTFGLVDGDWTICEPTPGSANSPAQLGSPASLLFNEWLAASGPGESDWIELYNTDMQSPVSLKRLFLSVTNQLFEITQSGFVAPGGYVRLWADENPGLDHLDFKLPAEGATLKLLSAGAQTLTSLTYSQQTEGVTQGRYPDGTDNIIDFTVSPTPGTPNSLTFPINITLNTTFVDLSWASVIGRFYRVETSKTLLPGSWTVAKDISATNGATTFEESLQKEGKFYRVLALP